MINAFLHGCEMIYGFYLRLQGSVAIVGFSTHVLVMINGGPNVTSALLDLREGSCKSYLNARSAS